MVSVIITCFGEPLLLERAIMSVANQTYTNWELIIVDDNDPESIERKSTETLLSGLRNSVSFRHIKHIANLNGSVARNTGFSHSKGKYIAFLDADDEFDTERLMICVTAIQSAKESYAGVYSGCTFLRKGEVYAKCIRAPTGRFLKESLACVFKFYSGSNLFVRASVYEELGGFDESLLRHQDYDFLVRLFEKYSLIGVERLLLFKNNDNRNLPNATKMLEVKSYYLAKYASILNDINDYEKSYVYYCHNLSMSEIYASEGNLGESLKFFLKSAKHRIEILSAVRIIVKYLRFLLL